MRQARKATIWVRQAAAFVSALSLLVHISLMAFGAQPPSRMAGDARIQHLHHSDAGDDFHPSEPVQVAGHPQPCCILSCLDGLPPAPDSARILPRLVSAILNFGDSTGSAGFRSPLPYPVGARAPPLSA
jgi:hypothetical protein